jgi:two-component system nitrate/nitrite response regulator NarL
MTMTLRSSVIAVPSSTRILLVAGCQLVGETLQATLASHGFDVVLSAGASAVETLEDVRVRRPGVVFLDLEGERPGFGRHLIRPLIDLGATVFILIGVADRLEEARWIEAGAVGVASNAESFSALLEKFRRVVIGEAATPLGDRMGSQRALDDHRRADRCRLAPFESLTPRERDVLAHIVDGQPAAEIARRAAVALPTVRTQIRSILQKLQVNSQMAAAAMARNAGWSLNCAPAGRHPIA